MSGIRAEDLYPDHIDIHDYQGIPVRKGTMAALIENTNILDSATSSEAEKAGARKMLEEYAPAMVVTGMYNIVSWKNSEVQGIMDRAAKEYEIK